MSLIPILRRPWFVQNGHIWHHNFSTLQTYRFGILCLSGICVHAWYYWIRSKTAYFGQILNILVRILIRQGKILSFVKIEQECLALFVSVKRHNNPGWTFHLLQKGWRLKGQKARGRRRTLSSKVGSKVKFGERDSLKPDEVAAHKDCKGRFLDTRTEEFSASSKVPF